MRLEHVLYRGFVNREFLMTFVYTYDAEGNYPTITEKSNGAIRINPSFGISLSEGYAKHWVYLTANKYYPFASLLQKSIKLISENLYDIFPDIGRMEFEIDSRVLERFKTEKALTAAEMTIIPEVWVDATSTCYPALRLNTLKSGTIVIPLEDAIAISKMLDTFEPNTFGLSMLRIIGKIE